MPNQKTELIPFINGMQPFYTSVKPIRSNGYQTVFNVGNFCILPRCFEGMPQFFRPTDKLVFTENFAFDDELIISSMYVNDTSGYVLELMSKTSHMRYCATGDEAYKIVMASKEGTVKGKFTFKCIKRSRYKYSLVLLDPLMEHFLAYKDDDSIFYSNYSIDVVQSLFNMLTEDTKDKLYFGSRIKI